MTMHFAASTSAFASASTFAVCADRVAVAVTPRSAVFVEFVPIEPQPGPGPQNAMAVSVAVPVGTRTHASIAVEGA